MGTPRQPYREGDLFAVPLTFGGYAIGVAARANRRGAVLGYFFGGWYESVPDADDVGQLTPSRAVLAQVFGDLGLVRGSWRVIAPLPGRRREDWPMPAFGRREELTGRCIRVEYSDDDPNSSPREIPVAAEECDRLPEDGAAGYRFVEAKLSTLVAGRPH